MFLMSQRNIYKRVSLFVIGAGLTQAAFAELSFYGFYSNTKMQGCHK